MQNQRKYRERRVLPYRSTVIKMKTYEAVAKRIECLCKEHKTTINGLANSAAVPPSTIKNIIYGASKNPGISTIKMLCDGLGISIVEFFDCEIFYDLEQEIE